MADSADGFTVEQHFAGKNPCVRELYDLLLVRLREFGPTAEDPKKTCIHLNHRTALAGVYPRKDYILLEFKTDYPIDSPLVAKTEQISRNRYHHSLRLESPAQLHGEVLRWLRDAHALSG